MPNLFPISLEVEEVAVGRVLRKLSGMEGVARVHLNLQTAKALAAPEERDEDDEGDTSRIVNQPIRRSQHALGLRDARSKRRSTPDKNECYRAIAAVLLKTPAHYKMLSAAVERTGYSGAGIHGMIYRMQQLKYIDRTSPGTYRLTKKGERTFGEQAFRDTRPLLSLPKRPGYKQIDNHSGARRVILEALLQHQDMTSAELVMALEKNNFSAKNYSTTGMKMRNEGLIEFQNGRFSITEAGRQAFSSPPTPDHSHDTEGLSTNG